MKSTYRIGAALAFGIVIILGALYVKANTPVSASNGALVVTAPERTYIESLDTDGDGVKDWEENLQGKIFETIQTPSTTADVVSAEPYTPPTTFTGKFSEAFFKDYLQGKIGSAETSDPTKLVGNAVEAIEKNTLSKRHTRLELTIIPSTDEALREYGNTIPKIIATHSVKTENAAVILNEALATNNPGLLEKIGPILTMYTKTTSDLLATPVPDSLVNEHIALMNAYEATVTNIGAMQVAFTDPLYALARIKGYEEDGKVLASSFKAIEAVLSARGISYSNDEAGAFFYIFDI